MTEPRSFQEMKNVRSAKKLQPNVLRYLELRGYTRNCPPAVLRKIRVICAHPRNVVDVERILEKVKEGFSKRRYIVSTTNNFRLSRFISVRDILKIRLGTCGAMATVVASVFRSLGAPTKLVNGWYTKKGENMRHAWNEIYVPSVRGFVPFDITRSNFRLDRFHKRKDEWIDWSDLEKVYKEERTR
ncbi:MAG: transglutaminase-like domain-containing protein [Parcubacteria group bacterium]